MKTRMPEEVLLPYSGAKSLIQEGDVLLFRAGRSFISYLISQTSQGLHSHAAMASWHDDMLECVEFREFKGGRTVNLQTQVDNQPNSIDVYRPKPEFPVYVLDNAIPVVDPEWHGTQSQANYVMQKYDGHAATHQMRKMTGLPYGWKRIWIMAQYHIPVVRWRAKPVFDDRATNGNVFPVCSTAVATSVRCGGYSGMVDLMPLKPDPYMTPPDIANSPVLDYMFTLGKDS